MGDLLRQYWLPFLPSTELPEPDGPPKKVRLLGEDLVAFRDTRGEVGLLAANCPHRGASLFFGRNEECGLRCVYHGWKFDVTGRCVDMPNEPAESTFKDKVRARAYPCRDVNGVIWTYMGPRAEAAAAARRSRSTRLPAEQVYPPLMMLEECNWVQALEGDIDSSHIDYVHAKLRAGQQAARHLPPGQAAAPRGPADGLRRLLLGAARWDVDGLYWHRVTQFILPFFSMIAASDPNIVSARAWVPLDDNYNLAVHDARAAGPAGDGRGARAVTRTRSPPGAAISRRRATRTTRYYTKANIHNDYLVDCRARQERAHDRHPVPGQPARPGDDRDDGADLRPHAGAPRHDRRHGHLRAAPADRRRPGAARAGRGAGQRRRSAMCRVRPASVLLPEGDSWITATEKARQSDAGVPIAWVPFAQ